ncbi:MAG: histidine phosphatase family protein [Mariprofundaceae bacterium]|nr:histidine phosphatase family protein [Mariprofundaceae bacterium]
MKTLFLIRHAQSDWGDPMTPDQQRPLNASGMRDAPRMGCMMKERNWRAGRWLCSTALRAQQTAAFMCNELDYPERDIYFSDALYLAEPQAILNQLARMDKNLDSLAVVAHNPGISELATQMGLPSFGGVPAGAVMVFTLDIDHWFKLIEGHFTAEAIGYETPERVAASPPKVTRKK